MNLTKQSVLMALAILTFTSFNACKENDDIEEIVSPVKNLGIAPIKTYTYTNHLNSTETYNFSYDSNGQVNGIDSEEQFLSFSTNPITFSFENDYYGRHKVDHIYDIKQNVSGCAISMIRECTVIDFYGTTKETEYDTLSYDTDNRLVSLKIVDHWAEAFDEGTEVIMYNLTWKNGDIVEISSPKNNGREKRIFKKFEYSDIKNNGIFIQEISGFPIFHSQLGLNGRPTRHLPSKLIDYPVVDDEQTYEEITTFTYEFDEEGRVTKVTSTTDEAGNPKPIVQVETYTY